MIFSLLGIITILSFSTSFVAKTVNDQVMDGGSKDVVKDVVTDEEVTTAIETSYVWPTTSKEVIRDFSTEYDGIIISGVEGDEITSTSSGIVTQAGWGDEGDGYYVTIDHENGLTSTYSHLKDVPMVSVGDNVEQGQVIGYLGDTGMATAPILDFSMTENDSSIDPQLYM